MTQVSYELPTASGAYRPARIAFIQAGWHADIVDQARVGFVEEMGRLGFPESMIDVVQTPGAFEIPTVALKMAQSGKYDAVICVGAVIRGSTPHFEYVSSEVSKGTAQVSLQFGLPVAFGVLTTDTIEQAVERAGTKAGNKGWDAMLSAIEMISLLSKLPPAGAPLVAPALSKSGKRA